MADSRKKTVDYKCPNCGAVLPYDAKTKKWICKFCDGSFTLEQLKKVKKDNTDTEKKEQEDTYSNYYTYNCKDCGAQIVADEQTSATFCIYCGNTAILKQKLEGKFKPDYIIPFKKSKEEAIEAFKNLSKGRPLVPKEFNNEANIEKIRGVYIPFWLYDVLVDGNLEGFATKVRTWRSGDYRFTETKNFKLYRDGYLNFANIPADGSTRFNDDIMNSIEPFDYKELEPFNHAYLSGFLAEKYDIESDEMFKTVGQRALNTSVNTMLEEKDEFFTTKNVTVNNLTAKQVKRKYVLLPVWMVNVKYKDKMYIFAMNGQTGEFIGDIPIDKKKAILYTILIFIGVFLLGILITFIIYVVSNGGI